MFLFSLFCVISSQNEHKCFIHLIILIHFFAFLSVWSITMLVYRLRIRSTYFFKFSVLPQLNVKTNNFKNIVAAKEKKIRSCFIYRSHCCWIYIYLFNRTHTHKHTRKYTRWWNCFAKKNDFFPLYRTKITSNNLTKFSLRRKIAMQFSQTFQIDLTVMKRKVEKNVFAKKFVKIFFFQKNLTVYSMANANTTWTIHTGSSTMYLQ